MARRAGAARRRTGRPWSACRPVDRAARLRAGAHFLPVGAAATRRERRRLHDLGRLLADARATGSGSACSRAGRRGIGERVRAYDPVRNGDVEVEVCSPHFFDPEGARLMVEPRRQERSALNGIATPAISAARRERSHRRGAYRHRLRERHRAARPARHACHRLQHRVRPRAAGWSAPRHRRCTHFRRDRSRAVDRRPQGIVPRPGGAAARGRRPVRRRDRPCDSRLVLQLSGANVRDVLAKGVPLDLHPGVFKWATSR